MEFKTSTSQNTMLITTDNGFKDDIDHLREKQHVLLLALRKLE